jgi:ubiquinone/menaquinone biosynthesis C-methylase UbiE
MAHAHDYRPLAACGLALLLLAGPASADEAVDSRRTPQTTYLGRTIAPTMHFSGAGWLTRPERDQEENPAAMLQALKIKPGQTVCDFGCGNGYHTLQLAKRVGPQGVVYAVDIQPEMLEMLAERADSRGLKNIKSVLPTADNPGMPEATFDLVLMVDVYHELADPESILAMVRASLKPKGRLVLVEFREEDPQVPILPLHKMSQAQAVKELTANKLKLVGQFDRLPWQHLLAFARNDSPLPAIDLTPWQRTP